MNCLIIGAGGTGKSIVRGLIKIKRVSNIYILNRSEESSKRVVNEIHDFKVKVFEEKEVLSLDYVILTLCAVNMNKRIKNILESKNTYEVRQKELKENLLAVKRKFPLFKILPEKTKIIVVTNPVDGIVNYLRKKFSKRDIFGFGLQLDANRYSKFLKKKVRVVGIHGKSIPLLNLLKEENYNNLYKKVDKPFFEYIRWNGLPYHIYNSEFKKYFSKLISKKKNLIYTSYLLKDYFDKIQNVSIGFLFYIKKGRILGIGKMRMSSVEMKRLEKDVGVLKDSIKMFT